MYIYIYIYLYIYTYIYLGGVSRAIFRRGCAIQPLNKVPINPEKIEEKLPINPEFL